MKNSQAQLVVALGLIFIFYALSAELTGALIEAMHGIPCSTSFLSTVCSYQDDTSVVGAGPFWLGMFLCVAGVGCFTIRRSSAYPFLALTIMLCSSALLWDSIFQRAIIHGPKIVNDTLNILGAVIAASFVMVVVLIRDQAYSLPRLALAVGLSFGVKTLSSVAYVSMSSALFGVTELFLLYVIYSFGSFTIHLMTVCGFVGSFTQAPRQEVIA